MFCGLGLLLLRQRNFLLQGFLFLGVLGNLFFQGTDGGVACLNLLLQIGNNVIGGGKLCFQRGVVRRGRSLLVGGKGGDAGF